VPDPQIPRRLILAPAARNDIREMLLWSREHFGRSAATRYRELLQRTLFDIAANPECPGSRARNELASGVRTYHLFFSRNRAASELGMVKKPRHLLVYRMRDDNVIQLIRVLHDSRDLSRHLPSD
jgi:toxin ParE1/3/4